MSIYEPHSRNRNRMNPAQQRFVDQQQQRRERSYEVERQVKRTHRRVSIARKVFTFLAICSFCILGSGAIAIFSQFSNDPIIKPTQAAIMINTPHPTTTLQSATWEAEPMQTSNDDAGFVIVPEGFWKIPGVVDAHRAGTPVAELVQQFGQGNQVAQSQNITQPIAQVEDPRIQQAKDDLAVAQIHAQIEAANLGPKMTATVMAADAIQTVQKKQAISDHLTGLGQLAVNIVFWLLICGAMIILARFVIVPLLDWLLGGLIDFFGNTIERFRFWRAEFQSPVSVEPEEHPELPEHLRAIQINHHGSERRQELEQRHRTLSNVTDEEIKAVLQVWDETHNMSDCQRKVFRVTNTGGGAFGKVESILKLYRPGYNSPTPPARIEPYFTGTTQ